MHLKPLLILVAAVATAIGAFAQGDPLDRCRLIPDPSARLACYDAIPAAAAAAAAAAAPAVPTDRAKKFGLPEARQDADVRAIESAVPSTFSGWGPNDKIRLENGQVWQVEDGSMAAVRPGAMRVSVRRGLLGAFYLDFDGLNKSPRVRRVE